MTAPWWKGARATLAVLAVAAWCGCGSDYRPQRLESTGEPAAPLGQVVDVEVALPNLMVAGAARPGVDLDLHLAIEGAVEGRHDARYVVDQARVDGHAAAVEELGTGKTTVTLTASAWTTGRIGPLRVEGTAFELLLDGEPRDGGWSVAGNAFESQTTLPGSFTGWRRHRFLVATTDFFSSGRVSEVALVKEREIRVRDGLTTVSSDPALRLTGGAVFAVNRLSFDNVQRLDPDRDFATAWQAGLGTGSNPQDVLLVSEDKAYVTRYEPPFDDVAVINPRGGTILGTIPLGGLAENPDGTPRPDRIVTADGAVFVGLQDIDRTFTRYGEGKLAVIDPALDEVTGVVPLGGKNPGPLRVVRGEDGRARVWVALGGILPGLQEQELSGGVVVVDVVNRVLERVALDDDDAGGNIGAFAMASERLAYVVVSDASYHNRLLAFDPGGDGVLRTVWETDDFIAEIEVDGNGLLAVPDASFTEPRLCLWDVPADPAEAERGRGCAGLGLTPVSVQALD
jgi:hypothetical protein